ncbi:hypothetical protein [Brevundimonas naejangsanensis]
MLQPTGLPFAPRLLAATVTGLLLDPLPFARSEPGGGWAVSLTVR